MKCFFCEQKDGNTNPGKTLEIRKRNWMGPGTDKSNWKTKDIPSPWTHGHGKIQGFSCYDGREKNPGETHKLHIGTQVACSSEKVMFCTSCNKLHVKEKEKWEGRQTGCIDL